MIKEALEHSTKSKLWSAELHIADLDGVYYGEVGKIWNDEAPTKDVCDGMQVLMEEVMAQPVEVQ
jgi:hypothetical protein